MRKRAAFKPYRQHQVRMLPINLDEMVPERHLVRVVDCAVESMDLTPLFARYPGGGTSAYNPVMLLKVILYAYMDKTYSSRRIAKASRENIYFMWLTGSTPLDFMTISRFRSERLCGMIDEIFIEMLRLLEQEGYITFEDYFLDGTKIEANASKYSWVWGKNTKRFKANLQKKVAELLADVDRSEAEENAAYGTDDLPEMGRAQEINSEAIREAAAKIDEKLRKMPDNRELKKAKKTILKDYLPRMEKYEKQEEILEERRSYSKTDTDATFMRMKEDHMRNGQLKPGYNVQIGTENQFITGFTIHQRPGDTACMIEHLEHVKKLAGKLPESITADAGYGSEENYEYLEKSGGEHYVKYNTFHKENSRKWREDPVRIQNWYYAKEHDEYICAAGQRLTFLYEKNQKSETGYSSIVRVYECESCEGCACRSRCVKSEQPGADRRIYVNRRLNELRGKARSNLESEEGRKKRSRRSVEVESVFGNIKWNYGMRRFLLRGLEKVKTEWGLHSIAHDIRKMAECRA